MTRSLRHVLCVDDERDILDVTRMCLETLAGLTVTCVNSGAKAVAEAATIKPDFIVLDAMMPGMDGPATLTALRKNAALDDIPIAFMTARVHPPDIAQYMEMGATGVIAKPFNPMTLADELRAIYDRFHAR